MLINENSKNPESTQKMKEQNVIISLMSSIEEEGIEMPSKKHYRDSIESADQTFYLS